jgi:hypothetical protein
MIPMDVATSFLPIVQVLASVMTTPTAETFQTLVGGWLMAPRRTILGMVRASGAERHHSAFHRFFSDARWSIDRAGLAVFDLITTSLKSVFLTVDDTLLPRTGLKVFGTGMHRDALLSSRSHTVTRWGHCWIVVCVVFESRLVPGRMFSLPVMCRLYLNKKAAGKWRRKYRTKNQLMREMLSKLETHARKQMKTLHLLGDSAFTAPAVLNELPAGVHVTGRVGRNVRIHAPVVRKPAGSPGRPPRRGKRMPTPAEMLKQKHLKRLSIQLYHGSTYRMRVATARGMFYKAPDREVLVIAVEHLKGGRGTEVFYTTDIEADVETVLRRFSWRWTIEVTFHDSKGHLGIDEPQNRTTNPVRRTAAIGFLLYSRSSGGMKQLTIRPCNGSEAGPASRPLRSPICWPHYAWNPCKQRSKTFMNTRTCPHLSRNSSTT